MVELCSALSPAAVAREARGGARMRWIYWLIGDRLTKRSRTVGVSRSIEEEEVSVVGVDGELLGKVDGRSDGADSMRRRWRYHYRCYAVNRPVDSGSESDRLACWNRITNQDHLLNLNCRGIQWRWREVSDEVVAEDDAAVDYDEDSLRLMMARKIWGWFEAVKK